MASPGANASTAGLLRSLYALATFFFNRYELLTSLLCLPPSNVSFSIATSGTSSPSSLKPSNSEGISFSRFFRSRKLVLASLLRRKASDRVFLAFASELRPLPEPEGTDRLLKRKLECSGVASEKLFQRSSWKAKEAGAAALPPLFRRRNAEGSDVSPVRSESSYLGLRFNSFLLILEL